MEPSTADLNVIKFIELLSNCTRLQDVMFMAMVKVFEKKNIVCSKYFYSIYFHMEKDESTNIYNLRGADTYFLQECTAATNKILDDAIISLNTTHIPQKYISSSNKDKINEEYNRSILALIYMYKKTPYKYLFIPTTVEYSINANMVHQTAIIVDLIKNKIIFYEPYGVYKKYSASYKDIVKIHLNTMKLPDEFYTNNQLNYTTWHELYGLDQGIQQILLEEHNLLKNNFDNDKKIFMDELKTSMPNLYDLLNRHLEADKNNPVHKDDYTFDTLEFVDIFSKSISYIPQEYAKYSALEYKALTLYYKYNSKTCVTITLAELYYFFNNLIDQPFNNQLIDLREFYAKFKDKKNNQLIIAIKELLNISLTPEIYTLLELPLNQICKKIL